MSLWFCGKSICTNVAWFDLAASGIRKLVEQLIQHFLVVDFTIAFEYLDLNRAILEEFYFPILPGHMNQNHHSLFADLLQRITYMDFLQPNKKRE
jgi:hypothetical protein